MNIPPLRILVTGSRYWRHPILIERALTQAAPPNRRIIIVHGQCDPRTPEGRPVPWDKAASWDGELLGADWHAHVAAIRLGWETDPHPANWTLYGKRAGHIRNAEMVKLGADVCLGFPLDDSSGTKGCLKLAVDANIPVRSYPMKRLVDA